MLSGGGGRDRFVFTSVSQSVAGRSDRITDFESRTDKIDLSGIDADTGAAGDQAFFVVSAFSNRAGEFVAFYDQESDRTFLPGDVNGDGQADLEVLVNGRLDSSFDFFL